MTINPISSSAALNLPGGETGAAIRARDWSDSALGPMEQWPLALRSVLSIMLNSPESQYLVWGVDRTFFFNDAYRPVLGPRLDGALGQDFRVLWADAWEQVRPVFERAMAGHASRFENQPISMARYGVPEQTWWSYSFSPVYDEREETVMGVLCHNLETTHLMQTESELRETQEFNSRVLASSNDCIKVIDLDGKLAFMSEGGMRVMEISDFNAVRGCPWPDFWQDQGHLDAVAAIAQAKAGLPGRFQGAANTYLGNPRWWDVQVTPIRDAAGNVEKILCISRDITATREAEEDLRRLNATLEERVEARTQDRDRIWRLSTDLMLIAEFGGEMVAVNPAWTQVLGWDQGELLGRSFLDFLHPDDDQITAAAAEKLSQGIGFPSFENRYRHKDGSYRWISWTAVPDHSYIHAVGRDVQVERQASEALRKTEDALRQAQKMEAVGQLTGGVAHDFNNLLTVVKASTDLLKRSLDEQRRRRYIDAISDAVDRASKLTGQLLAFSRQQTLRPEIFEVGNSVRAIGEMIGSLTGARIKVLIELPVQPCHINADAGQFDTALINMAVNARDAMNGEGTLKICVETVQRLPARRAHAASQGDYVAVSLIDTGSGIALEQLDRIFEPFFTTKEVGKGTGLGLSQVFGFAKQSGGEVIVESQPQAGSKFTLYLPQAIPVAVTEQPGIEQGLPSDGEGARLLVVEDNLQIGEFSTQTLRELGYQIHWAKNGTEALAALADPTTTFDAVFSDVVMPGMNGVELALEVKRLYPLMPIVLTSGYSPALAQGNSQGFTFLQKPYSVEALARLLRAEISGR